MKRQILSTLALAASGLWLFSCDSQKVTGTVDETNASAARLVNTAGVPVSGANLLVYHLDDTTIDPVTSGITLADGSYSLRQVPDGLYRIVARTSDKVAVLDSVYTSQGKLLVRTDTVRNAGSLYGFVKMVGDDNPASVEVSVLGSGVSFVIVNSDGSYLLDGLGTGSWKLKFSTSLPGYANTYVKAQSKADSSSKVDTVTMNYIGIPPVANLMGTYDSLTNRIHLTWNIPANVKGIRDFQILRTDLAGNADPFLVGTSDTISFVDSTIYRMSSGISINWLYYVRIQTFDGSLGRIAYIKVKTTGGPRTSIDSAVKYGDSTHHDTSIVVVDTTHRDSVILSQHAKDSLQRIAILDSLVNLKFSYTRLLDSARITHDTAFGDTAALEIQILQIQHLYDSLAAAPLAGVVGTSGSIQIAWRNSNGICDREAGAARWESLWLRDEGETIAIET